MYYPDMKHMMQRYRGGNNWNTRSADNTAYHAGVEALRSEASSPSERHGVSPTQLNWTRTSVEALSAELERVQGQHGRLAWQSACDHCMDGCIEAVHGQFCRMCSDRVQH